MAPIASGKHFWVILLNQALQMPNKMLLRWRMTLSLSNMQNGGLVPGNHPLDTSVERRSHSYCLILNKKDMFRCAVWASVHVMMIWSGSTDCYCIFSNLETVQTVCGIFESTCTKNRSLSSSQNPELAPRDADCRLGQWDLKWDSCWIYHLSTFFLMAWSYMVAVWQKNETYLGFPVVLCLHNFHINIKTNSGKPCWYSWCFCFFIILSSI